MLVKSEGRMCVEWGRKTEESIVKKACRPEVRKKHPKFNIEHVRDTFRFRATVYSFRDIVEFILAEQHKCKADAVAVDRTDRGPGGSWVRAPYSCDCCTV